VRIAHDVGLLDLAVLLEETRDLVLGEGRVDARDEEVGALVAAAFLVLLVARCWGWTAACPVSKGLLYSIVSNVPAIAIIPTIGRGAADT